MYVLSFPVSSSLEVMVGVNSHLCKYRCLSLRAFHEHRSQCRDICLFHVAAASSHQDYTAASLFTNTLCLVKADNAFLKRLKINIQIQGMVQMRRRTVMPDQKKPPAGKKYVTWVHKMAKRAYKMLGRWLWLLSLSFRGIFEKVAL